MRVMKIKKGFLKRKIGEKFLVISTEKVNGNNMFIELNDTSSDIWDMLEKGYDTDKIAQKLAKKYSVSQEKALADTQSLLSQMKAAGVLED